MNAIQFIQQHGIDKAREVVSGALDASTAFNIVSGSIIYYQLCDNWWWHNPVKKEWEMDYSKSMRINLSDLKRLVERIDLVEKVGGISQAKYFYENFECVHIGLDLVTCRALGKAIADYEAIYSGAEQ